MNRTTLKKRILLVLPILLLMSTALVFLSLSQWFGRELGYLLGFTFYWVMWCLIVPLILLGKHGFSSLFREEIPLFRKENWLPISLLIATTIGAFFMFFIPNIAITPIPIIIIGILVAIINGTFEEILWRGLYVKIFPNKVLLGLIYPSIGFAVWHISPQLVFPSEGGIIGVMIFIISTFFLGFCYGWVSYKTRSIKWNALSHSINSILAFGIPISSSLVTLIFS
jgi:membrane protease YdiL (CAAX protease family)